MPLTAGPNMARDVSGGANGWKLLKRRFTAMGNDILGDVDGTRAPKSL